MHDWAGFKLADLAKAQSEEQLDAVMADLRQWIESCWPAGTGQSDEPTGRTFALETANDILAIPADRRDACMGQIREANLAQRIIAADPREIARRILVEQGIPRPIAWLASKLEKRLVHHVVQQIWTDDGEFSSAQEIIDATTKKSIDFIPTEEMDRRIAEQEAATPAPRM